MTDMMTRWRLFMQRNEVPMAVSVLLLVCWVLLWEVPWFNDENTHFHQTLLFEQGQWEMLTIVTTLPGFNALMSLGGKLLPLPYEPGAYRLLPTLVAIGSVWLVWDIIAQLRQRDATTRLLQYAFLPAVFYFAVSFHTEYTAHAGLLLGLMLGLRKHYALSALALGVAVLVRQQNLIWLGGIPLIVAMCAGQRLTDVKALWTWGWQRYWTLIPVGVAWLAFFAWNGGVALGHQHMHSGGFYLSNHFVLLAVCGVLWWPLLLTRWATVWAVLRRRWWVTLLVGVLLAGAYWWGMSPTHEFLYYKLEARNYGDWGVLWEEGGKLKNYIMDNVRQSAVARAAFGGVSALGGLVLLSLRGGWRIGVAGLLSLVVLLPQEHISLRYYVTPLLLLVLLQGEQSDREAKLMTGYFLGLAVFIFYTQFVGDWTVHFY